MLKLTRLMFLFCLMIAVAACGGNDDDANPSGGTNDLQGTWKALSMNGNLNTMASGVSSDLTFYGSNYDYTIVFGTSDWNTSGGYDVTTEGISGGVLIPPSISEIRNVMGNGTYTISGNMITVDKSFFDLAASGVPTTGTGGMQTATWSINTDGHLVFNQNETSTDSSTGITITSTLVSTSTWEKQ